MDALRRAETQEQEKQAEPDPVTEPAPDPADLKLEPINPGAELVEELRTETDAFVSDTSPESPDESPPQDQVRTAAALVTVPATAWQKKALFFLSGFVTILTIVGGYYLWRSDRSIIPATTHSATLIDTPSSEPHSKPVIETLPTPSATAVAAKTPALPVAPIPAPTARPNVETVSATDTPGVAVTQPVQRIEIHKSRKIHTVHPLIQKAYRAYQQRNYVEAQQLYRKALKRYPDNRDAALGLAAIAIHQGNRQVARYYYQRVLKANPADKTAQIALSSLNSSRNNLQETSQLKYWLQDDRNNAQLHFALGNRYASAGQWKEAQQAYFDAQRIDPGNPDYAFNLAISLDQLGLPEQALKYYLNARQQADKSTALFSVQQLDKRIRQLQQGTTP